MSLLRSLEMGLDVEEFLRLLPSAVAPHPFHSGDTGITVCHTEGEVRIELQPMPDRRIGALSLPVTRVTIHSRVSESRLGDFLDHFDLRYQKGGG